jgi:hypothetical protein
MAEEVQIRNSTAQAKVRSPVAVVLLTIFTIGIYGLFWWYYINREMKDLGQAHGTDECGTSPGTSLLALFPGGLIIVPALVSYYRGFQRMQAAGRLVGREETANGWIGVILFLVFSPLYVAYVQSDLNKTWERQAAPGGAIADGAGPGTAIGDAPADTAPAEPPPAGQSGTTGS